MLRVTLAASPAVILCAFDSVLARRITVDQERGMFIGTEFTNTHSVNYYVALPHVGVVIKM